MYGRVVGSVPNYMAQETGQGAKCSKGIIDRLSNASISVEDDSELYFSLRFSVRLASLEQADVGADKKVHTSAKLVLHIRYPNEGDPVAVNSDFLSLENFLPN